MLIFSVDASIDSFFTWVETDFSESFWAHFAEEMFLPSIREVWVRSMAFAVCIGFSILLGRDKQRNQEQMHRIAYFDSLTGLPNAAFFWEEMVGSWLTHAEIIYKLHCFRLTWIN